jgi:hypothetical protein
MFLVDIQQTPADNYYGTRLSLTFTLLTCSGFTSATSIILIGVERVIAITWPLHYARIVTEKTLAGAVVALWVAPMVSVFPGYVFFLQNAEQEKDLIWLRNLHYVLVIMAYCVFAISLCGTYGKIYYDARAQVKRIQTLSTTQGHIPSADSNKAMTVVLIVILTFLVLNLPYVVHGTLKLYGVDPAGVNSRVILLEVVSLAFGQANSAVHVAVYAIFSLQFRRGYGIVMCFFKHVQHSDEREAENIILSRRSTKEQRHTVPNG